MTDYGFIRVSQGSQDAQTQELDIVGAFPEAVIVRTSTKAASASKGEQLDAMDALIARLRSGDRVVVTDSSRLDRDPDEWAQMARLLAIKATGAEVADLSNPAFGSSQKFAVVMTALHQTANAEKSRTVKVQTWRGTKALIANRAHRGNLPVFWVSEGERYAKQARCTDPGKVQDIYARIGGGESLASIGHSYDLYPAQLRRLIRFEANMTGVEMCAYTHEGIREEWAHKVIPVVDKDTYYRAVKALEANKGQGRVVNLGGRRTIDGNWISGVFTCTECGGNLYLMAGMGNRPSKLRCVGSKKDRRTCGKFKPVDAAPVIDALGSMFGSDDNPILAWDRIAGNAHELDALNASLARIQGRLSATDDDDELDALVAERKSLRVSIAAFVVIPDSYAYTETGQTVASMWNEGTDDVRRNMVLAVRKAGWIQVDQEAVRMAVYWNPEGTGDVVDLGNGFCFKRRITTSAIMT